jgi:hypothetical protein
MLKLKKVTLAAIACTHMYETVQAMKYSMKKAEFCDAVFISHKKPFYLPENIRYEYTSRNESEDDFSYKVIFDLHKYIKTDFALLVHYDGFVINPDMWRAEFLNYDYIGSPWPENKALADIDGNVCRVGNGVSLRSKKLMELPSKINLPFEPGFKGSYNEDLLICAKYKHIFEANGIKFAPVETAKHFGREASVPENKNIKTFLFHDYFGENINNKRFGRVWLKYWFISKPFFILNRTFLKPVIKKIRKKYDVLAKYK